MVRELVYVINMDEVFGKDVMVHGSFWRSPEISRNDIADNEKKYHALDFAFLWNVTEMQHVKFRAIIRQSNNSY